MKNGIGLLPIKNATFWWFETWKNTFLNMRY
jgi:hypothetical protein